MSGQLEFGFIENPYKVSSVARSNLLFITWGEIDWWLTDFSV
jgi:hypothetical protein